MASQQTQQHGPTNILELVLSWVGQVFIFLGDLLFLPLQRWFGVRSMAYVFVLPNLVIFGVFILFPMLLNFNYAMSGGGNLFPQERPFVGMTNFAELFNCDNFFAPNTCSQDRFARASINTIFYVLFQVAFMVLAAVVTAMALNYKIKFKAFFRGVFFFPVLLSPIVVALIWKWILQENGVLNAILLSFGLDKISFLTSAAWSKFWIVFISIWADMGFYTLILLAGLQAIPGELYEASKIEGAGRLATFRFITMPLLMPTLLVVLVLSLIRAVQVFDIVFAFTGGGPGTSTLYIVQYIYTNGFASPSRQYGLAAAASVVMGLVLIVLTFIQLGLGRRRS